MDPLDQFALFCAVTFLGLVIAVSFVLLRTGCLVAGRMMTMVQQRQSIPRRHLSPRSINVCRGLLVIVTGFGSAGALLSLFDTSLKLSGTFAATFVIAQFVLAFGVLFFYFRPSEADENERIWNRALFLVTMMLVWVTCQFFGKNFTFSLVAGFMLAYLNYFLDSLTGDLLGV